jgi:hypothetical protein
VLPAGQYFAAMVGKGRTNTRSRAARCLRWLALLPVVVMAACAVEPNSPFQPTSTGVGGNPYGPPTVTPPEEIDNDAGQLIGTRASDGGGYDAPPRSEGDAAFPDDAAPLLADSGTALPDSGPLRPPPDTGTPSVDDATPPTPEASPSDDATASQDAAPPDAAAPSADAGMGADSAPPPAEDAAPPMEAGPLVPDLCPTTLGAGDLAIVEFMLVSQEGGGDLGQWVEVQSTRSCTLNLNGLHAAASATGSPNTMDLTSDVYLPANSMFVIANSLDPALNNELPTTPLLFGWDGSPADVLDTAGGVVTLSNTATSVVIDNFVYPQFQTIIVGTSISFPADCAWSDRSDWARWSFSTHNWYSSFIGTPNAPNTDVTCY